MRSMRPAADGQPLVVRLQLALVSLHHVRRILRSLLYVALTWRIQV